jgi:hypothetical protein
VTTSPPRSVALLGPDVVLLALETLGTGTAASSNAVLVVELAAAVDPRRLESALARFLGHCPWLGGRLARPRPWGKLCWRVPAGGPTPPPVRTRRLAAGELGAFVDRELGTPLDPHSEAPLRFTVVNEDGTTRLVLTWAHALMDPHGSEYLLRLLADLDERLDDTAPWVTPPVLVAPPETRSFRERGALASQGAAQLRSLAPVAPISLAARVGHPTGLRRHRRFRFHAGPAASDRPRRGMPWRLAVVAKAMTALFVQRGRPTDAPFLVPVSVDRRPRGEPGPVLGNYLGFHFARCRPPVDGDTATLARALRDQLAEAIRQNALEAGWAGMSFARYRPLRGMFRELPWAAGGDFCSFHFADTDALLPDRSHLFGAAVVGGYHVASVPDRPGTGVFFSRAGAVESVVVSWANDVLDDADAETLAGIVQHEMGWTPFTE